MKYIIIGLGNYGSVLAEELTLLGHDVIGVDSNEYKVDEMKDKITTAFSLNAADDLSLNMLPLSSVDVVIVAIGKNFGASIRIVALLKKHQVKHIYARAVDDLHKTVLESFNLDTILFPERDSARSLVRLLDTHVDVESFQIDSEYYVLKFKGPASLVGRKVDDLSLKGLFGITILSLVKGRKAINSLGVSIVDNQVENLFDANYKLEENDHLVCYGKYKDFTSFWKAL